MTKKFALDRAQRKNRTRTELISGILRTWNHRVRGRVCQWWDDPDPPSHRMTSEPRVSPAALAHMERLKAYYDDPAAAPHENPPTPPTPEIACELTASIAQLVAIAIDFERTGQVNMEPSMEAKMTAAALIDERLDNL